MALERTPTYENVQTTVDLYGKLVPSVDAALADAVGAAIFDAPDNVTPLPATGSGSGPGGPPCLS